MNTDLFFPKDFEKQMGWFSSKIRFLILEPTFNHFEAQGKTRTPARWRTSVASAGTTGPVNHYCRHHHQQQEEEEEETR